MASPLAPAAAVVCLTLLGLMNGQASTLDLGTCTEENIKTCVAHMVKFNLTELSTIVPNFELETITQICKEYPQAEDCMKPLWPDCPAHQRNVYQGVANNYDYICNDTWEEYQKHRECLQTPALHVEGTRCNQTLESNLQILGFYNNQHYIRSKMCQYASDYVTCVYNSVLPYCGEAAADWQRGFDISSIDPLMKGIGCVHTGEGYIYQQVAKNTGSSLTTMILPIVLVLLLLVIVVAMIIFLIKKRRKLMAEHPQPQHPMEHGLPPSGHVRYQNGNVAMMVPPGPGPAPPPGGPMDNGAYLLPPPYTEKETQPPSYSQAGSSPSPVDPPPPQASGVDPVNSLPMEAGGKALSAQEPSHT